MSCDVLRLADGSAAVFCGGRRKSLFCHVCGKVAEFLCDERDCDRPLCGAHSEHYTIGKDLCLEHAKGAAVQPELAL